MFSVLDLVLWTLKAQIIPHSPFLAALGDVGELQWRKIWTEVFSDSTDLSTVAEFDVEFSSGSARPWTHGVKSK